MRLIENQTPDSKCVVYFDDNTQQYMIYLRNENANQACHDRFLKSTYSRHEANNYITEKKHD